MESPTPIASPTQERGLKKRLKLSRTSLMVGGVIVVLLGVTGYLFWQNTRLRSSDYQKEAQQRENKRLIDEVRGVLLLPEDEEPTIATITNIDDLKSVNEPFYADAQNGDKILFYSTRAVIYRDEENLIINLAPITLTPADQSGLEQSGDAGETPEGE